MPNLVNGNGGDDDATNDHLLDPFGPPHLLATHVENGNSQCSDQGTENRSLTPTETRTANNHRGNHK